MKQGGHLDMMHYTPSTLNGRVLDALSTIADGGESNAHILLCSLRSFDFIVSLVEHLSYINSLCKALQKEGTNLLAALESAKASL